MMNRSSTRFPGFRAVFETHSLAALLLCLLVVYFVPPLTSSVSGQASSVSGQESTSSVQEGQQKKRPNIVVLFADDAGYADFGFQPKAAADMKKQTPFIDSIAKRGARFSNAYMSGCVCSPSRAGLMTGRYQSRFGHENNIPPGYMKGGLPLSETFLSKRLQTLRYQTGLIGKWHLGYPKKYQPNQRGYDWFYGCLQGSRSYFPMKKTTPHRVFLENDKPTKEQGYITDRIGDGAVKFIEQNKAKPFFLFVSFTAPHGPLQAKDTDLKKLHQIENTKRRKYAGLVKSMDDNVGKILECLKRNKLSDNTIVIFTNDNGGQTSTGANNSPLRGKKGTLWEGGIRVPMAIMWPGKIKSDQVIDDPVISLDFLPTFVAAAGGATENSWELDGQNLLPRLTGKLDRLPARDLYWRKGGKTNQIAIRSANWKLIQNRSSKPMTSALFDLTKDSSEQTNVAAQHADVFKTMAAKIKSWETELKDPLWGTRQRKPRKMNKRKKS